MAPDSTDDNKDDKQLPSTDATPLNLQSEPGETEITLPVPGDIIEAGNDTNAPRADSPETPEAVANEGSENDIIQDGQNLVDQLAEDNQAPFSPPTDPVNDAAADLDVRTAGNQLDPMHQATDNATDIDNQQLYDEGLAGAAEASEPNAGNAVTNYNPDSDNRNTDQT